jgi:hypothetical protein
MNTQDWGIYNMTANQEVYSIFLVLAPSHLCVFIPQFNEKGAKGVISIVMSFACVNTSLTHLQKSSVCGGAKYNKTGLIIYTMNGRAVLPKSRMRENLKSGSVRGLIAASMRRWL